MVYNISLFTFHYNIYKYILAFLDTTYHYMLLLDIATFFYLVFIIIGIFFFVSGSDWIFFKKSILNTFHFVLADSINDKILEDLIHIFMYTYKYLISKGAVQAYTTHWTIKIHINILISEASEKAEMGPMNFLHLCFNALHGLSTGVALLCFIIHLLSNLLILIALHGPSTGVALLCFIIHLLSNIILSSWENFFMWQREIGFTLCLFRTLASFISQYIIVVLHLIIRVGVVWDKDLINHLPRHWSTLVSKILIHSVAVFLLVVL
ncbi:hypothetical protein ACJX0J_029897, partial [Zea mays]